MKTKILLVDDEEGIHQMVGEVLDGEGYDVAAASDGREGLKAFFAWQPNLVLLDILMPDMDGWKLLERIREVAEVPVIIMTALDREQYAVRGLRGGADDYIVKPVPLHELVARVEASLRRVRAPASVREEYRDSVLHLDFPRHQVYARGDLVALSPQEFRLLSALVRNANFVMSSDQLLKTCWEDVGGPENVRVYVGYLRKKLEDDPSNPRLIETVREFGYCYRAPAS